MAQHLSRTSYLIDKAILYFGLNLAGITVLTEAATGPFTVTPVIALRAGAKRVLCLTEDSRHGTVKQVMEQTMALINQMGITRFPEIFEDRNRCPVEAADVITNLGFVRPLNAALINRLNPNAVISLMWEPWELRPGEIDIAACREKGVLVVGTNEQDPRLQTFKAIGLTVMKLLFQLDIEMLGSNIAILHDCPIGKEVGLTLSQNGAKIIEMELSTWKRSKEAVLREQLKHADALVFLVHKSDDPLLRGPDAPRLNEIISPVPPLKIIHISGNVDLSVFHSNALEFIPKIIAPPRCMSVNASFLGVKPVIDLHTAGLHIGTACFAARSHYTNDDDVIRDAQRYAPVLEVIPCV
jgi:hypothetical protein